jgi:hypothetical protein
MSISTVTTRATPTSRSRTARTRVLTGSVMPSPPPRGGGTVPLEYRSFPRNWLVPTEPQGDAGVVERQ